MLWCRRHRLYRAPITLSGLARVVTVVPRIGRNTLKLTRLCSPPKVVIMLSWFIRKSTCVLAMPKSPERSKNLMFILTVFGAPKKSPFMVLLKTTLSQVPLRTTRTLHPPVKVISLVHSLGELMSFIGPVGREMTTHPVPWVILLGTLPIQGRKLRLPASGQHYGPVLFSRSFVTNIGQ